MLARDDKMVELSFALEPLRWARAPGLVGDAAGAVVTHGPSPRSGRDSSGHGPRSADRELAARQRDGTGFEPLRRKQRYLAPGALPREARGDAVTRTAQRRGKSCC